MKRSIPIKYLFVFVVFSMFLSNFFVIGYSNVVGIPSGLQVTHNLSSSVMPTHSSVLTFTQTSSDMMHVKWHLGSPINDVGSWDVNTSNRIVSNQQNFGLFNDSHDCFWIFTDVSLHDSIMMSNIWKWVHTGNADTVFNITGEEMHGTREVWVLEDAYGSEVWYEKERGILINGTSKYSTDYHTYEFVKAEIPGIPGYNYILLFSILAIVSIIIVKKRKINKKIVN